MIINYIAKIQNIIINIYIKMVFSCSDHGKKTCYIDFLIVIYI